MVGLFFGFLGSPYERDCSLRAPLESQTTNLPIVDVNCLPHQVVVWEFLGVSGNGRVLYVIKPPGPSKEVPKWWELFIDHPLEGAGMLDLFFTFPGMKPFYNWVPYIKASYNLDLGWFRLGLGLVGLGMFFRLVDLQSSPFFQTWKVPTDSDVWKIFGIPL